MQEHGFVSAVQQSARIPDHAHARQAVRATLMVLDQRLSTEGPRGPAALREAVGAEYLHVLDQLPADYGDLTHTENAQH